MSLRARGEKPGIPSALPFTSVNTYTQAEELMVRYASWKKDNTGFTMAHSGWWTGELDDLERLARLFEGESKRRKKR